MVVTNVPSGISSHPCLLHTTLTHIIRLASLRYQEKFNPCLTWQLRSRCQKRSRSNCENATKLRQHSTESQQTPQKRSPFYKLFLGAEFELRACIETCD